jgi:hypothetical protein
MKTTTIVLLELLGAARVLEDAAMAEVTLQSLCFRTKLFIEASECTHGQGHLPGRHHQ